MLDSKLNELLNIAIKASLKGGRKILEVYGSEFSVEYKEDKSPLTLADKSANEAIMEFLEPTGVPVLSEEGAHVEYEKRKDWEYLWVVDPLDGTKEFVKRNGEFTVNIALVKNGLPIMGVIYVPVQKCLYFGLQELGAFKVNEIEVHEGGLDELLESALKLPLEQNRNFTMVGSRSHMSPETATYFETVKKSHPKAELISRGSSLKICMVAEGSADVYPRFAPTMEWDTAAGHGIARQAGFEVFKTDIEEPLDYNKKDLLNPWFIVKGKVS